MDKLKFNLEDMKIDITEDEVVVQDGAESLAATVYQMRESMKEQAIKDWLEKEGWANPKENEALKRRIADLTSALHEVLIDLNEVGQEHGYDFDSKWQARKALKNEK